MSPYADAEKGMDKRFAVLMVIAFLLTQPLWMMGAYLNDTLESDELIVVKHFFNWTPKVMVAVILLGTILLCVNRVTDGALLNKILESPDACSRLAFGLLITIGLILCFS